MDLRYGHPGFDSASCLRQLALSAIVITGGRDAASFERDGEWVIAYCSEVPGANGQGRTKSDARVSLAEAIALILEDRRDDGLRGLPPDAEREIITVEIQTA